MGEQLNQFRLVQSLEENTVKIYDAVRDQKRMLQDSSKREARRNILAWVSSVNYSQKHRTLQSSREKDTGTWIVQTEEYMRWRDGLGSSNILWCHGIQGSGKTNLVSVIIDDLLRSDSSRAWPTAFFYFDHQDRHSQGALAVMSCIVKQTLEELSEIPEPLAELYKKRSPKGQLSLHEYQSLLADLVTRLGGIYLVIDALDECDPKHRKPFLQAISQLSQIQNVQLLVTSRPHMQYLTEMFGHYTTLRIEAQEEDLKRYLHQELDRQGISYRADPDFVKRLVQKLTQGAEGMFLLPVLQLRTVLKQPTQGEMEDKLADLSHSLGDAFEDAISRIQGLPEGYSRLGIDTLMWLAHAARPLTVSELSDTLAIQRDRKAVNVKYRPSTKVIIECCQGLVVIDSEGYIRVAHHAIQEYLVDHYEDLFPRAQATMALNCLQYLLFEDFKDGPWDTKDEIESHLQLYSFLKYAARYWGQHTREAGSDVEVQSLLFQFFASRPAMASANQIWQYSLGRQHLYWNTEECWSYRPLHHASRHGLEHAVSKLLENGMHHVNEGTKMGGTPIINAASGGHVQTVKKLLEHGANPYMENWYGNALHCAIETGKSGTIRQLVAWGMDPNESMGPRAFLDCALDRDSANAFKILVELGADIEAQSVDSPLHLFFNAALQDCERIVELMIQRSWVDVEMRGLDGLSAIHHAVRGSALEAVRKLIEAGADINTQDEMGWSPLDYAVAIDNQAIIRLLAESGAFVRG